MNSKRAVFYDVDGTLVKTGVLYVFAYYSLRQPRLSDKFRRMLQGLLLSPAYLLARKFNSGLFDRVFYANYRGMDYERLRLMGRDIVRDVLIPNLYDDARRRIRQARDMDLTQVLVSGSLDFVVEPFARELGIDHVITNRLEFRGRKATGRLLEPLVTGGTRATRIQEFARAHDIDLSRSYAFGDSVTGPGMFEAVGFPCAVNPDARLRKKAEDAGWAITAFA